SFEALANLLDHLALAIITDECLPRGERKQPAKGEPPFMMRRDADVNAGVIDAPIRPAPMDASRTRTGGKERSSCSTPRSTSFIAVRLVPSGAVMPISNSPSSVLAGVNSCRTIR